MDYSGRAIVPQVCPLLGAIFPETLQKQGCFGVPDGI